MKIYGNHLFTLLILGIFSTVVPIPPEIPDWRQSPFSPNLDMMPDWPEEEATELLQSQFTPESRSFFGDLLKQVGSALLPNVVNKVTGLWSSGNQEFLGKMCEYKVKPFISHWELTYDARFSCNALSKQEGKGVSVNKDHSIKFAMEDFAKKILAEGNASFDKSLVEGFLKG